MLMIVLGLALAPGGSILAQPHGRVKARAAITPLQRDGRVQALPLGRPTSSPLVTLPSSAMAADPAGLADATQPSESREIAPGAQVIAPSPSASQWRWHPAGEVIAPILLYHHIGEETSSLRYVVSLGDFEAQMASLQRWGYTTIPLSLLLKALTEGAALPPRPVVITFDDGYREVYTHALPILQRYGFTAAVFVVIGQVGVGKSLTADQIRELAAAGWEIGSHSWSHANLRQSGVNLKHEIGDARLALEQILGEPVTAFAFPYGLTSPYVTRLVQEAGYEVALGLGGSYRHKEKGRYYLSRIEIQGNFDLKAFASLLPWHNIEPAMDGEGRGPNPR